MADERTVRLALPLMHAGQAQKEITHNEALTALDALVNPLVQSADETAPPEEPDQGACWIVAVGPSGAWAGQGGRLAQWTAGGWRFHDLSAGAHAWVVDRDGAMVADGEGGWADAPAQADGYHVGGQRIVGARGAAVANPSAGTTIDTEARAAIIAILDRMRAHGLIAAS